MKLKINEFIPSDLLFRPTRSVQSPFCPWPPPPFCTLDSTATKSEKEKAVDVTRLVDGGGSGGKNAGISGGDRVGRCFNCRGFGHVARVCPSGRGAGKGCYNCGEHRHAARDCQKVASPAGGGGGSSGGGRGGSGRSGGGGGECYNCGEKGHYKRECINDSRNN